MQVLSLIVLACSFVADPPTTIKVDHDNIEITKSCTIELATDPILDADNNGVIHISGDDITIEFKPEANHLHGAAKDQQPDSFTGVGITVKGRHITLRGARISGYRVGIYAVECDGLTVDDIDVSGNFQQHLKSTPKAEDASDWLWPHANDNHEWITNYGAGICVEKSSAVTLNNITAHHGQNGMILDRVNESKVYDCDCSFLSGWGLAMWRSNKNVISRNAFDFCIRGYSHGVYNRGQDSAGILMFEQCCENIIAENSATHCGDGFFGFAGKEALGEVNPREDLEWYKGRGCNKNVVHLNDFSFAAAHGLELTFSFDNTIQGCRFLENAICGVWGGYSQRSHIWDNTFKGNGLAGSGHERGGVNIEHGRDNAIELNKFLKNACGVFLWNDRDPELEATPWARINEPTCAANEVVWNVFRENDVAVQIQECDRSTVAADELDSNHQNILVDPASLKSIMRDCVSRDKALREPVVFGDHEPTGKRENLDGREHIIMTEWGPWDHQSPLLQYIQRFDHADEYQLRGAWAKPVADEIKSTGEVFVDVNDDRIFVRPKKKDTILPYSFSFEADGQQLSATGTLTGGSWEVWTFPSACDPREDVERWRREGASKHHTLGADDIDFRFGNGGMSEARHLPVALPRDHFGVIATRTLTIPAGKWRIKTTSDDGLRVWMGDQLVIDDWTWHGPKEISHDFELAKPQVFPLRVEYFELDGYAILSLKIESRN